MITVEDQLNLDRDHAVRTALLASWRVVVGAHKAVRVAGPRLNSNFDRDFAPKLEMLCAAVAEAVAVLNHGASMSDAKAADLASQIEQRCKNLDGLISQCKALRLDEREPYSSLLARLAYHRDHARHISESLLNSLDPEFQARIRKSLEELKSAIGESPACPSASST
jgi:hypothetical protein